MRYLVLVILSFSISAYSQSKLIKLEGGINDFIVSEGKIYAAKENGEIEIYNYITHKSIQKITLPLIKDYTFKEINPKIFSIDKYLDQLVIVSEGDKGGRNVFIYSKEKLNKILDNTISKGIISKAIFVNENKILFSLLSNEICLYNFTSKKMIYKNQISPYSFSDMCLNMDRTELLVGDESGVLNKIDVESGSTLTEYKGQHVDKIFDIDFNNSVIISGGRDRRIVVYHNLIDDYHLTGDFFIYCVAIDKNDSKGAYVSNETNDIIVFDTQTKQELELFSGVENVITKLYFENDKQLISSTNEGEIYIWEIK